MRAFLTLLLAVPFARAAGTAPVLSVPLPGKGRAVEIRRGPCKEGSCPLLLAFKDGGREGAGLDLASDPALTVYDGKIEPLERGEGEEPALPGLKTVSVAPLKQDPEEGGAVIVSVLPVAWAPGVSGFLLDLSSMVAAEGAPTSEFAGVAVRDGKFLPVWRDNSYQMSDEDFLTAVSFKTRKTKGGAVEAVFMLTNGDKTRMHGVLRWDATASRLAYGKR